MTTPRMERWIHAVEPMAPPSYWEMLDWLRWKLDTLESIGDDRCVMSEIIDGLTLYEAMRHGGAVDGTDGQDQSSPANESGREVDGGGVLGLSPVGNAASVHQVAADCRGV